AGPPVVPVLGKALGPRQSRSLGLVQPLCLEQRLDLRPGQRRLDERIAERLDGDYMAKVTTPSALLGRLVRMPPGFVKAITAPPSCCDRVAASWASVMIWPSTLSPPGPSSRDKVAVIDPTGRPPGGLTSAS